MRGLGAAAGEMAAAEGRLRLWKRLGVYGSHYFYYKIAVKPGAALKADVPKGDAELSRARMENNWHVGRR